MAKNKGQQAMPEALKSTATLRVRDYMTSNVTTITDDARLLDAALLIRRTGKRHVPIVNAENEPVGIISDRDVARLAPSMLSRMSPTEYNDVFEQTSISQVMTKPTITVTPDTPVSEAVNILFAKKIGALLVVDDRKLTGILTIADMLGLLNELLAERENTTGAAQ